MTRWVPILIIGALAAIAAPVHAQSLSRGDYALCEVRDRDGRSLGYDSVCLEARRAALRHYAADRGHRRGSYHHPAPVASTPWVYYCPAWANNGHGYIGTAGLRGGYGSIAGTFDSPLNGNHCVPRPTYVIRGWN